MTLRALAEQVREQFQENHRMLYSSHGDLETCARPFCVSLRLFLEAVCAALDSAPEIQRYCVFAREHHRVDGGFTAEAIVETHPEGDLVKWADYEAAILRLIEQVELD